MFGGALDLKRCKTLTNNFRTLVRLLLLQKTKPYENKQKQKSKLKLWLKWHKKDSTRIVIILVINDITIIMYWYLEHWQYHKLYLCILSWKKSGSSINPDIHHSKVPSSELETFVLDTHNPDHLISISTYKFN